MFKILASRAKFQVKKQNLAKLQNYLTIYLYHNNILTLAYMYILYIILNNIIIILARFDSVLEGRVKMSDLCIGCGEIDVHAEHPLFEGGLCKGCKVREREVVGLHGWLYVAIVVPTVSSPC